jgi:hypothetical protein
MARHTPLAVLWIWRTTKRNGLYRVALPKVGDRKRFQSTCTSEADQPRKAAPTLEDIVDAIAALDPAKDFGKNGKPNVEALEDLLDANITAAQRDEAWDVFQKEQAEENGGEG